VLARLRDLDQKNADAVGNLDKQINDLQSRLSTQRLTLSEEAALQLQSDLDRKTTERKRKAEDAAASLTDLRDRLFRTVQAELMAIIGQIGKDLGYDMIFDVGNGIVVYANPATDLSAEVIKRYDASKAEPAK
jgi:outer membrane protein